MNTIPILVLPPPLLLSVKNNNFLFQNSRKIADRKTRSEIALPKMLSFNGLIRGLLMLVDNPKALFHFWAGQIAGGWGYPEILINILFQEKKFVISAMTTLTIIGSQVTGNLEIQKNPAKNRVKPLLSIGGSNDSQGRTQTILTCRISNTYTTCFFPHAGRRDHQLGIFLTYITYTA